MSARRAPGGRAVDGVSDGGRRNTFLPGTAGATLRVKVEHGTDRAKLEEDNRARLTDLIAIADEAAGIKARTGRTKP